jgi:four helix bundle protein
MVMMKNDLKDRTKRFALSIMELIELMPNTISGRVIANQLIKSGTSVGANYRAVCRARSDKEFISKMQIVLEETDETSYWLEIIQSKKWISDEILNPVLTEANELTAIFVSSLKTINAKKPTNSKL